MSKQLTLGVVMDPIQSINPKKDTTLRLMDKAESLGWQLRYMEIQDLSLKKGVACGRSQHLQVISDPKKWWSLSNPEDHPLHELDVILMRLDPPVTMEYIYATHLLEYAEAKGSLVVNRPAALRAANEKLYATWFPHCMPETLVSSSMSELKAFIESEETVVLKPLSGMAGEGIFKCQRGDSNISVIIETLTKFETEFCMAQRYIKEITAGDKRIFLIDGEPVPYALARIPAKGEFRGNLARGGQGVGVRLSDRDHYICAEIGPKLREAGLLFVGIDVIGDYLTEINVTSPTCVREVEDAFDYDIAGQILACIESKL